MSTLNLHHVWASSVSVKRITLHILIMCLMAFSLPAVSQQPEVSTAGALPDSTGETVAENTGCKGPELCADEDQTGSILPNAPSADRRLPVPASSLTFGDRFRIYRQALVRPYTIVGPAFGAGIGQWEDEPPEWGQGAQGYGRRFASGISRSVISETIRFGFAAADGEDPRYKRSEEAGVWPRTKHVIVETFTSETASGTRIPAFSRFAGVYGAAFISNAWYPESRATTGYALRRGSTALASSLGFHLFEEFAPRKYFKALHIGD